MVGIPQSVEGLGQGLGDGRIVVIFPGRRKKFLSSPSAQTGSGVNTPSCSMDTAGSSPVNNGRWQGKTENSPATRAEVKITGQTVNLSYKTSPLNTRRGLQLRVSEKKNVEVEVAGSYQIMVTFYCYITVDRTL